MAVTSLWARTGRVDQVIDYVRNPEKTTFVSAEQMAALHTIDGVIQYTVNDLKTEKRAYVSCINCSSEENAATEFLKTKIFWENTLGMSKTTGRVCYHGYQSFKPGEVDADTAHKIGVALAEELWGERFQVIVATHLNTNHIHNHFVINSVSNIDGKKFHSGAKELALLRQTSDRLCREYGLSVIKDPMTKSKHYAEWAAEQNGKPTKRSIIKADIDRAIMASTTMRDFYKVMEQMGYTFKVHTKNGERLIHPVVIPPGAGKGVRLDGLGSSYTFEGISRRILMNIRKQLPFPEVTDRHLGRYHYKGSYKKIKKHTGFMALYYYYCYKLKTIRKRPASVKRVPVSLREDIIQFDRRMEETRFLAKHKIETSDELRNRRQYTAKQIDTLTDSRRILRNDLKRFSRLEDIEQVTAIKAQISALTEEIKNYRKEEKMCDSIAQRSGLVKEGLDYIIQQEASERKEKSQNERSKRRSGTDRAYVIGER